MYTSEGDTGSRLIVPALARITTAFVNLEAEQPTRGVEVGAYLGTLRWWRKDSLPHV